MQCEGESIVSHGRSLRRPFTFEADIHRRWPPAVPFDFRIADLSRRVAYAVTRAHGFSCFWITLDRVSICDVPREHAGVRERKTERERASFPSDLGERSSRIFSFFLFLLYRNYKLDPGMSDSICAEVVTCAFLPEEAPKKSDVRYRSIRRAISRELP
jgi:hypothetical protein